MPTEKNPPTSLRRLILDQSVSGAAVPMVLFSDDTLAAGADRADHPPAIAEAAAGQGIDLDGLELFSFDAYKVQSALGEELAP